MQAVEAIERPRISVASKLVGLLAVAIFINYVDRGLLGIAGPLISKELHLNNLNFGVLASAFFWSYTLAMLGAGWLAERINPYRTLALGFAIWSVATALTGFVGGFAVLFVLRFIL